jgi:hypothetical protein
MREPGGLDHDAIGDLERQLKAANERWQQTLKRLQFKHQRKDRDVHLACGKEVLRLERLLAAAKGDEYAEPIEFPVRWDTGAPLPHLLVNDDRALLAFLLSEPDPAWDGTSVRMVSPARNDPEPLALVTFEFCASAKLGSPNDEVFGGHPLWGKGLEHYAAQRVVNSRWLKEVETINSVHPHYSHSRWTDLQHFIFGFHDSTFECLAKAFKVEVHRMAMRDLLIRMAVG